MSRGNNQKLKLYYLAKILEEQTDETHYITMPDIIKRLEELDVTAERKSIYKDIEELDRFGLEVEGVKQGKNYYYHVIGRQFELAELKLLVDVIQSSKFITAKKSKVLINKLETLCSEHEARQLSRQVFVQDRIKTMNESIYYSVDAIHSAISDNKQIRFKYYNWNAAKEMELRRNGEFYQVSPWALIWDDENYYLVAFDAEAYKIKHYRVDKMLKISTVEEGRLGKEHFEQFNVANYSRKNFGMYGGREETVTVLCDNSLVGVFIDRFGKDISIQAEDEKHSRIRFTVAVSGQFFGWIFALGSGVRIIGPSSVVEDIKSESNRIFAQYNASSESQ